MMMTMMMMVMVFLYCESQKSWSRRHMENCHPPPPPKSSKTRGAIASPNPLCKSTRIQFALRMARAPSSPAHPYISTPSSFWVDGNHHAKWTEARQRSNKQIRQTEARNTQLARVDRRANTGVAQGRNAHGGEPSRTNTESMTLSGKEKTPQ